MGQGFKNSGFSELPPSDSESLKPEIVEVSAPVDADPTQSATLDVKGVGEAENTPLDDLGKKERKVEPHEKLSDEAVEVYRAEAQQFLGSYKNFFKTYAGDSSITFNLGDKFFFDLERGVVNSDIRWFAERGYSKEQILWVHLHELQHFRDFSEAPEAMLENFEHMRTQAKVTGEKIREKFEATFGDINPELIEWLKTQHQVSPDDPMKTMNAYDKAGYEIHHSFFNVFEDIHVNTGVARRAPRYEPTSRGGKEIERLYREKSFPNTDYTKQPRHLQFIYKCLREEMVPEDVVLTDEVRERLNQLIRYKGKDYTVKQIIDNFIKPRSGRDTSPGTRFKVYRETLEPLFLELLQKDLDDWDPTAQREGDSDEEGTGTPSGPGEGESEKPAEGMPQQPQDGEPSQGDVNPFSGDYKTLRDNSPDQIPDEDLQKLAKKKIEEKEEKEHEDAEPDTPESTPEEVEKKADEAWAAKEGVDPQALEKYRALEDEVAPYLDELAKLWQQIVYGSSTENVRTVSGQHKTGVDLNIPSVINEWPRIEHAQFDDVRVMRRPISEAQSVERPELIRVRLSGDQSGSMYPGYEEDARRYRLDPDEVEKLGEKQRILRQCIVLIESSLREFNTYLNLTRSVTKSKLVADSEIWLYGDEAQRVKEFRGTDNFDNEFAKTVNGLGEANEDRGGTENHTVLNEIKNSLTDEDREKIARKKILDIVIEVTDGGSRNPRRARRAVDDLLSAGVVVRALQIGEPNEIEAERFEDVWNMGRDERLGALVGTKLENLLPAVVEILRSHLKNIKL